MTKDQLQQTLESRLCRLAEQVNKTLGQQDDAESACTIYLYDFRRDKYVLRATTKPTQSLGIDELRISPDTRKRYRKGDRRRIGLTVATIFDNRPRFCNNIHQCEEYSCFEMRPDEIRTWEETHVCEFTNDELWSFLAAPISFSEVSEDKQTGPSQGVIRVVRKKNKEAQGVDFRESDAQELKSLIEKELNWIQSGAFLSQLIELGTYTNVRTLCEKAAVVFRNLLTGKGCSIFLLEESRQLDTSGGVNFYRCYGSTGLVKRHGEAMFEDIKDTFKAGYKFHKGLAKASKDPVKMPLTMGVVRARTSAFIDNIYPRFRTQTEKINSVK